MRLYREFTELDGDLVAVYGDMEVFWKLTVVFMRNYPGFFVYTGDFIVDSWEIPWDLMVAHRNLTNKWIQVGFT